MIDRTEVSRALAKAIAYKNCGRNDEANEWAGKLVCLLECGDILTHEYHQYEALPDRLKSLHE